MLVRSSRRRLRGTIDCGWRSDLGLRLKHLGKGGRCWWLWEGDGFAKGPAAQKSGGLDLKWRNVAEGQEIYIG